MMCRLFIEIQVVFVGEEAVVRRGRKTLDGGRTDQMPTILAVGGVGSDVLLHRGLCARVGMIDLRPVLDDEVASC